MPVRAIRFTESATGTVYTAKTSIPRGSRVLDILIENLAPWAAATQSLTIGDADAEDALVSDWQFTDQFTHEATLASGTAWGDANGGGKAYPADGGTGKLYPAGGLLTLVLTTTVPDTPTGLTVVTIWYEPQGAGSAPVVTAP